MPEITIKSAPANPISNPQGDVMDDMVAFYFTNNPSDLSKKDIHQVNTIGDYLKTLSEDEFERANILRDIRMRLGTPHISTNKLEQVYKYVKLKRSLEKTEQDMKEMEL